MFFFTNLYIRCKQKKYWAYSFTILLFISIFFSNGLIAHGADFKHNHTGACYTNGTGPCTSAHSTSVRTESSTKHCHNCGAQRTHTMYVYWDRCYGLGQDYELGGYHVCNTCGATGHTWGSTSAGTHMVSQKVLSCGKSNVATGTLWIRNTLSDWTRENVILETGVSVYNSSLSMAAQPYSWDNQISWTGENTKQVSENGTYTVYAKSSDGTVVGESVNVTNIDRTAPVLKSVEPSIFEWTNQEVILSLVAEDVQPDGSTGCGLAETPYSYDGGVSYVADNNFTASDNGVYEVYLSDALGNKGQAQIEVTNIDKMAPVISDIARTNEGWQSQNVMMKVWAEDIESGSGLHEMAYSLDGEIWQTEPEFLFSENGVYAIYVRDVAGNMAVKEFDVNQIDITAPIIESIQAIPDRIWADKVEVIINAKDIQPDGSIGCGLNEIAYSVDGGLTWQESNTFVVETGIKYDVRVRDALLWESEEYIVERKDLPYPKPVQDINSNSSDNSQTNTEQPEAKPDETGQDDIITENEKPDGGDNEFDTKVKSPYIDWNKANAAISEGLYSFGNLFAQEESPVEDGYEISNSTVELNNNADDNIREFQVIKMPWYTTTVGKTVIVSAGTLSAGTIIGIVVYLFIFSAGVYCIEDENREHKLGRVMIHRIKEGYSVFLSDMLLKGASIPKYRIKINSIMIKKVKNARLLVESNEKNLEVLMQESIDFEL